MLTLEARGHGVSALLMTLNRGEGGQNKIGSNLSDVLGVLRPLELLASDQYYGVQERFSRVADFGFSKSAEETFAKWGGHDVALGGHGAGDSDVPSRCSGAAFLGYSARWPWASSGVEHTRSGGVPGGG